MSDNKESSSPARGNSKSYKDKRNEKKQQK